MKTYTKEQIIKQLIIGTVLSVIACIVMLASGIWESSGMPIGGLLLMIPIAIVAFPIGFMEIFYVNWKKAIIGIIAPIPMLSFSIELFKGLGRAYCAVFALIRGKDSYTFNKYGVDKNSNEE